MNYGFDAKRAFQNTTGLGNYARDLLRILAQRRPGHRYLAYGAGKAGAPAGAGEGPAVCPVNGGGDWLVPGLERRGPDTTWGRCLPRLWRLCGLTAQLRRDGVQLFHGLSNELPLGLERSGVRSVVTIHDLIFERFPALFSPVDRRLYAWKYRSAVARADRIIAISGQTRDDLVELYGVNPSRIRVVHQGCRPAFQAPPAPGADDEVARRLDLPPRFLLCVGTVERRKNLELVVKALPGLPGVPLLVVGRQTGYAGEVRALARRLGVEDRLRFTRTDCAGTLAALYRRCTVSVYPSRYEGFGIPIVEALFCGAPVVTTPGGACQEAAGPGAGYVGPDDVDGMRELLAALLADEGRRAEMSAAGRRHARRFEDEAIAEGLDAVYRELVG